MNADTRKLGRLKIVWWASGTACLLACLAVSAAPQVSQSPSPTSPAAARSAPATNQVPRPVKFSSAVAGVVRLLDSGVGIDIIKTYIQSSAVAFSMTPDDIIALNERGVPSDVVVAMLKRNGELRSQAAAAAPVPAPSPALAPAQSAAVPQVAPAYQGMQPAVYAPEPAYPIAPYTYSYPSSYYYYWYSSYPLFTSWWWWPSWGYYPYRRHYAPYYYHHDGRGYYAGVHRSYRWPDAYPNRLVVGPNWGADRGFAGRSGGFRQGQARWSGAYPNRLVTGPSWGANRGFATRPVSAPVRGGGGFQGRAGGFGGGRGHAGHR